jgi:predicted transposase YdaD
MESLKMSEEERSMYVSVFERVYTKKGREEGLREGMEKGRFDMARNLLSFGVSPDVIAQSSGLSMEDIRAMMG